MRMSIECKGNLVIITQGRYNRREFLVFDNGQVHCVSGIPAKGDRELAIEIFLSK